MTMKWGSTEFDELLEFQEQFEKVTDEELEMFFIDTSKELAARFLALVIPLTPVGEYPASTGKVGGTLRRNWTAGQSEESYVYTIQVVKKGTAYEIEIYNPTEYAEYVEFGHRTGNGRGWVWGRFMMTKSEIILNQEAPDIIRKRFEDMLRGKMKNG